MNPYPMIAQLQYGTANAFGKNLCVSPSRIVPLSQKEIVDDKKTYFYYMTPRQEIEFVLREPRSLLFEPTAYFRPPHTFLQSVLFLIEPRFYQVAHLPRMRRDVLLRWLKERLAKHPEGALFLQHLLAQEFDTDPSHNKYFPVLVSLIETHSPLVILHADREGRCKGMTPQKTPEPKSIVLLQMASGWYAPYGSSM